jgi:hypothetical protein
VTLMKPLKLILLATAVLAITSLVGGTIISMQQTQAKYITNQHAHSDIENLKGNDGSVTNCSGENCANSWGSEKYHINTNDNTNRPVGEDGVRSHTNSHEMPNKGGNSDKGDDTDNSDEADSNDESEP